MVEESVYVSGEKTYHFVPPGNAIVTGANKGIGLGICRQLACNGILVILTARDEKRGKEAAEVLKLSGLSGVVYHQLEVKDPASISSLVDFVKARFGKLDILVNNAAESGVTVDLEASKFRHQVEHGEVELEQEEAMYAHGILQQTYEGAVECLKTNYFGCKHVTEALVPLLQQSRSPRIVNVSSFYGQLKNISNEKTREQLSDLNQLTEERVEEQLDKFLKDFKEGLLDAHGWPTATAAYRVSKAALNAYTRILAKRFPSFCVNCVHPGYAKTDMNPATSRQKKVQELRSCWPCYLTAVRLASTLIRWKSLSSETLFSVLIACYTCMAYAVSINRKEVKLFQQNPCSGSDRFLK